MVAPAIAPPSRLLYLDDLRTFLTILVICHHCAIAFGASGSWYYVVPPSPVSPAPFVLTLFAAVNQSFFMSLFFAVSGYFVPPARERKGGARFVRDRLLRLGVPLVVYSFLLNPIVRWLAARFRGGDESLLAFVSEDPASKLGTGPLWFVLALLLFSLAWAAVRGLRERRGAAPRRRPFPDDRRILAFVVAVGLAAFAVRLVFPVGRELLGLQLGYFPLYVAFFVFGVWAREGAWLPALTRERVAPWFRAALVAMAALPLALVLLGARSGNDGGAFSGGPSLEALLYALWEPWLCVGISLRLLVLFRERFDRQGPLARRMARSAYTAYIVQPFFVVPGTALLASLPVDALLRFLLLCPLAVVPCFAVSDAIRRLPGLRRVL